MVIKQKLNILLLKLRKMRIKARRQVWIKLWESFSKILKRKLCAYRSFKIQLQIHMFFCEPKKEFFCKGISNPPKTIWPPCTHLNLYVTSWSRTSCIQWLSNPLNSFVSILVTSFLCVQKFSKHGKIHRIWLRPTTGNFTFWIQY